ncbi:Rha family transcriptional regulator, partial [Bacillus subtilis]|uniref:Rha family transcriptional regulator n=2 Tax=Bacillaceae TaxID=186817 RepID=UPI00059DA2CA
MNNTLKLIELNGQYLADSRDVAEMTGKRHSDLIRTIKGYIDTILTDAKLRSSDFFITSTYEDSKGEIRPCFLLTKKGCEMVANKMTGEKGVLFTAEYVT